MKSYKLLLLCLLLVQSFLLSSQVKTYHHSDGGIVSPLVLSFVDFTSNPNDVSNKPRFSFFFHLAEYYDIDVNNFFGFYSGLTLLNIGFIAKNENLDIEKRFRSYALGLPVAFKIGSFRESFYFYGGGEYQWLFHYKEKTYINDDKIKRSEWFSRKTPFFIPSVFAGIHFPKDWTVSFHYQLKEFLNTAYFNPADNYNAQFGIPTGHIFWISLAKSNIEKLFKPQTETRNVVFTHYCK